MPPFSPKLFSAANSQHWAPLSQTKTNLILPVKPSQQPIPASATEQQDFRKHWENFFGNSSTSFISEDLTPSLSHSLLQGNKLSSTVLPAATNTHKSIQNALLSILSALQTSPGFTLQDFDAQLCSEEPGRDNTYRKKAKNSLIRKELIRDTGWGGGLLIKLPGTPAPC